MAQETRPRIWLSDLLMGDIAVKDDEHALLLRVIQPALAGLMDGSVGPLNKVLVMCSIQ